MIDYCWLFFAAGILIGWLTKIPFFLKWYKEWETERLELWESQKRILELIKQKGKI